MTTPPPRLLRWAYRTDPPQPLRKAERFEEALRWSSAGRAFILLNPLLTDV